MKNKIPLNDATMQALPLPVALITSVSKDGQHNVATISYNGIACEQGLQIITSAIRPIRKTFDNIVETGKYCINIPTRDMHPAVLSCGSVSGRRRNKIDMLRSQGYSMSALDSGVYKINECPINIECVLLKDEQGLLFGNPFDGILRFDKLFPEATHALVFGEIVNLYQTDSIENLDLIVTANYDIKEVGATIARANFVAELEREEREGI
jgi:flavin reductase (DIM6/NTAB) family NADH-FMN oxidoreductase RutF